MPPLPKKKYSISVTALTYDRLRTLEPENVAKFVDGIIVSALEDPLILKRLTRACQPN